MKAGRASQTSVLVCMGRALAHARREVPQFADPTARLLLPDEARARVERAIERAPTDSIRERLFRAYLERQSEVMIARTVAIDELVRSAGAKQLVILGAGLDGRAWRMPELAETIVFEVDHPDTQRDKRARVSACETLEKKAREVRFVAVDFTRDSLDDALTKAGHDPTLPTTWIWEGVVMYLARPAIEATLRVIARRSAKTSRLSITYHSPSIVRRLMGIAVALVGEPFRSAFTPSELRTLLAPHGFSVVDDAPIPTLAARLSQELARRTQRVGHLRIAAAERV